MKSASSCTDFAGPLFVVSEGFLFESRLLVAVARLDLASGLGLKTPAPGCQGPRLVSSGLRVLAHISSAHTSEGLARDLCWSGQAVLWKAAVQAQECGHLPGSARSPQRPPASNEETALRTTETHLTAAWTWLLWSRLQAESKAEAFGYRLQKEESSPSSLGQVRSPLHTSAGHKAVRLGDLIIPQHP